MTFGSRLTIVFGGKRENVAEADDGRRDEHVLRQAAVLVIAQGHALRAAVALADATKLADAAGDNRAEGHLLACLQPGHAIAESGDCARDLVAGDDAGAGVLLALVDADVGVTEAGRPGAQQYLTRTGLRVGDVHDG
jgi:hypothetical protein